MQQRYYEPYAARFMSVDPVTTDAKTGDNFNRYVYANSNPYRFVDPDGRDSFLVSRPLGDNSDSMYFVHNFVVANASRVGDPKASIFSYGKQDSGKTGPVDDKTAGMSKGTAARDAAYWKSLGGDAKKDQAMTAKINAPDAKVVDVATSVKADTPYSITPGLSSNATNSNSAGSAVADRAQGSEVKLPAAEGRGAVGANQKDRINFK